MRNSSLKFARYIQNISFNHAVSFNDKKITLGLQNSRRLISEVVMGFRDLEAS